MTKRILIGVALLLSVLLILLAVVPVPRTVRHTDHGATLSFRLSRGMVFTPASCVTLTWETEGIRTIFLGDAPAIGTGETTVCDHLAIPTTFTVTFPNEAQEIYILPVTVLANSPIYYAGWVLVLALVGLVFFPANLSLRVVRLAETAAIYSVIVLVLLEVGVRVWAVTVATEREQLLYLGSATEIIAASATYAPMPYLNFGLATEADDVNVLGFRGELVDIEKPADTYRIVAHGGSTTYGLGLSADETWPSYLEQILHEDYGYTQVEVVNAGVGAYTSWNTLLSFQFRTIELDPDLVIVYHAVNDIFEMTRVSPSCWYGPNTNLGLGYATTMVSVNETQLSPSAFYRFLQIQLGLVADPTELARDSRRGGSVGCNPDEPGAENNTPRYFGRNLRHLATLAEAEGIDVMLSSWTFRDYASLGMISHPVLSQTGIHNDIIAGVAAETAANYYDLAAEMEGRLDYWQADTFHQTAAGARRQAALYAAYLDDMGLIPLPDSTS